MKWWRLPGPARFIDATQQALCEGSSVILGLPRHAPADLCAAIAEPLRTGSDWLVEAVQVEAGADPLQQVTCALYLEPESWGRWSTTSLVAALEARGSNQLVVVDAVSEQDWDRWRRFLLEYEVASRSCAAQGRPVLLVAAAGVPPKRLQTPGAALSLRLWQGVFSELDALLYASQALRERTGWRHPKLAARQIANLALWDVTLADFLLQQREADLFAPLPLLQRALQETALGRDRGSAWEHGGCDRFDGQDTTHSLVLAARQGSGQQELERRVWAAQAGELLPLIELRRREAAEQLGRFVKCPLWLDGLNREKAIRVDSLSDLEIGQLAHVMRTSGQLPEGRLRERIEVLVRLRNQLAHLNLLCAEDAWHAHLHG